VEVSGFADPASDASDPTRFPVRTRRAAHGGPWFMDATEARAGAGVAWFRMNHATIDGAGSLSKVPLSSVLGPADWTHGIARSFSDVVADPNPNLTVQLFRQPEGRWIGIRADAKWRPAGGLGVGSGVLLDIHGEIDRISMSVILAPFPHQTKPESAAGPAPASNWLPKTGDFGLHPFMGVN